MEQAQAQAEQFRVQLEYTMKENEEVKKYAKDTIDTSMVNYINKCKEEGKSRESTLEGLAFIFSKVYVLGRLIVYCCTSLSNERSREL